MNFPGIEFLATEPKLRRRNKNSSWCVCVLHKTWSLAFSRRRRLVTNWNEQKSAARAKLLFCLLNVLLVLRSRCSRPAFNIATSLAVKALFVEHHLFLEKQTLSKFWFNQIKLKRVSWSELYICYIKMLGFVRTAETQIKSNFSFFCGSFIWIITPF